MKENVSNIQILEHLSFKFVFFGSILRLNGLEKHFKRLLEVIVVYWQYIHKCVEKQHTGLLWFAVSE